MSQPLLPCPFCGGTDQYVERSTLSSCFVQCDCNARGPVGVQSSDDEETPGHDDAITEWNRRTEPSPAEPLKVGDEPEYDYDLHALIRTTGLVSNSDCYDLVDLIRTKYIPKQMPSTEPSPADVTRYGCTTGGMEEQEDGDYVLYCDYRQATQQSPATVEGELWAKLQEANDYGQFNDDFDQPLAKPIRKLIRDLCALNQRLAVKEGEAEFKRGVLEGRGDGFSILRNMCVEGIIVTSDQIGIFVDRLGGYKSTHPVSDDQQAKDAALEERLRGFRLTAIGPCDYLTDEANSERRWMLERVEPPFEINGNRFWIGATIDAALSATKQEG